MVKMTCIKRNELVCGLASACFGLAALFATCFAPLVYYHSVTTTENSVTTEHSGYESYLQSVGPGGLSQSTPYFLFVIVTFLLLAVSVFIHVKRGDTVSQWIIWGLTILVFVEMLLALASIGLFLVPGFVLAVVASVFAGMQSTREGRS
jgi:hypothetical protein